MAVRLSIVSSFDKKGINAAEKALTKFQKTYKLTDAQMQGGIGKLASASIALQQYGNRIQGYGKRMQSFGNALTKYITLPALGAATALGSIALRKGWASLKNLDEARTKLEALGYTAAEVEGAMQSARDATKGTAYSAADAASVASSMMKAGVDQGEQLTKVLGLVADSASIAGVEYSAMGATWSKVASRGTLASKDLNKFMGQGIPILQVLGDYYGVTADKAQEMVKQGKVDFADFASAMEGYLGGAASKAATTFTGLGTQISKAFARIGANLLGSGDSGIFGQIKPLLAEFRDWLVGFEDVAAEWGAVIGQAFRAIVERGKELVKVFFPGNFDLSPAKDAADKAKRFINDAFDVIIKIAKGVKGALDMIPSSLKKWLVFGGPVISLVGKMTSGIGSLTVSVGKATAKLANFAAKIATSEGGLLKLGKGGLIGAAVAAFAILAVQIGKVVAQYSKMDKAIHGFEDGATLMRSSAGEISEGMGIAKAAVDGYMQACRDAIDAQAELVDSANQKYAEAGAEIGKLDYYAGIIAKYGEQSGLTAEEQAELAAAIDYVNQETGKSIQLTDAANGVMSESPAAIQEYIDAKKRQIEQEAALAVYQEMVEQHIKNEIALKKAQAKQDEIYNQMLTATGSELEGLQAEYDTLGQTIDQLNRQDAALNDEMQSALDIYGEYSGKTDSATQATKSLGTEVGKTASKFSTAGANAAKGFVSSIKSGINGSLGTARSLGTNVANAIGKGAGAFSFVNSATLLASNLLKGIKSALGIHSPSTEGLAIGENVANAIGLGFEDGMVDASRTASSALSGFVGGVSATGSYTATAAAPTARGGNVYNIYIDGNRAEAAGIDDAVGRFLNDLATLGAMQNGVVANG